MKIGYCANMLARDTDGVGYDWIECLMDAGYDYLELPAAQLSVLDKHAFREKVIRPLRDTGFPCLTMNNFFPASYRLTGPEANRNAALSYARRVMDIASSLGVNIIVFGSSGARNAPDGADLDSCFLQIADFLSELSPIARLYGIQVVIEHLNRLEANLINRLTDAVRLAKLVNQDNIGVLADYYHMRLSFEDFNVISEAKPYLKHIHIARPLRRQTPREGDMEPYQRFFQCLSFACYNATISVEAYADKENEEESVRDTLIFLRSFIA